MSIQNVGAYNLQGLGSRILEQPAVQHLLSLMPVLDLRATSFATTQAFCAEPKQDAAVKEMARVLYRSEQRHALLTGAPGVGKTTTAFKLAADVRDVRYEFLNESALLYLDVRNVGDHDSRACLETILSAVEQCGKTLLIIDEIAALFSTTHGRSNKALIRALLDRANLSVIGTMTNWDYSEQVGNDLLMIKTFSRVQLDEPDERPLAALVRFAAAALSDIHELTIPDYLSDRAIALSSTFLLSEYQPAKAVSVLRRACEDIRFRQARSSESSTIVGEEDVVQVIAEKTLIPAETIRGQGRCFDFFQPLADAVVGQADAIRQVATELEMIAAGLSEPNKPASVLMFAGTTGVGKTELAKRIAEIYSSSGRLQVYPMGNFTEPHSVSGLVGVPPGYVGHEDGGRIVNDLLADPYSVFLLDEAEKCHPNIWKPFLNLFDEGWIVDQRGRRAYADRAIFILTTNAGDRSISQLTRSGKSREEIVEQVRKTLSRVRQERSSQPVFPPQFLSRMKRIIVFNPLLEEAMIQIAGRVVSIVSNRWLISRRKELVVGKELVEQIGRRGAVINESVNGEEGGRVITKLIRECIEHKVLTRARVEPEAYSNCSRIIVGLVNNCPDATDCQTQVRFE